jgi:D-glycero-alpha-D-manno-heptose-7-phosphate kinase
MTVPDLTTCGRLLGANWALKQKMAAGITNDDIDRMYRTAMDAGALAGKVAGAGGGGFLLMMVPRENQNRVFEAMRDYRELPFMLETGGSKVIFDDRTYADN